MMNGNHPRVYDLLHPSPVSLKKITAASIALDLCREEIKKYRRINALNRLRFERISLDSLVPIIPSKLLQLIKKCKTDIESSIENFIEYHDEYAFKFYHKDKNEVLNDFDDFVVDYDGSINYHKTAKRVILCDRFSDVEKFVIACQYNFEEDVVRLWPCVWTVIKLHDFQDSVHFKYTSLRYWVGRLTFDKNYFGIFDTDWAELLLKEASFDITSTMDHFWEKIDSNARVRVAVAQFNKFYNEYKFCRYILPKLNEYELVKFMDLRGEDLIPNLLKNEFWMDMVLPVWKLVKSKIIDVDFIAIVRQIIETQTNHNSHFDPSDCGEKIWEDASPQMKDIVIRDILSLSNSSIFKRTAFSSCRQTGFLLKMLSLMTLRESRRFWYKNWPYLISGTNSYDLKDLMNLCFRNRKTIKNFRKNKLSRYKIIAPYCLEFLKDENYNELERFLIFCCPRQETRKRIKSKLLFNDFKVRFWHLRDAISLDYFISCACDYDEDKIFKYKDSLTRRLTLNDDLYDVLLTGKYHQLKELVDTLVVSEEVDVYLREHHFPYLVRRFINSTSFLRDFQGEELSKFLRWCFEDDEKVEQFKQSLPIDEVVRAVADEVLSGDKRRCRNYDLDAYMEWYFPNPEFLADFKAVHADLFEQIGQN